MTVAGSRQILSPPHRVSVAMRDPEFLRRFGVHARPTDASEAVDGAADLTIGSAPVHFALQGDGLGTQLAYEAASDNESDLKAEIDRFLDRLQAEIAGPPEKAAAGPLVNTARVASRGLPPLPGQIFGMPLVFWAGSAIFLFLCGMMFASYL
jgi:hypothetical protein